MLPYNPDERDPLEEPPTPKEVAACVVLLIVTAIALFVAGCSVGQSTTPTLRTFPAVDTIYAPCPRIEQVEPQDKLRWIMTHKAVLNRRT